MLQRHQRNNLDQIVAFARDQLSRDLQTFKDPSSKTGLLATTATRMLDMYSNMSYPLVGFQIIKQNLTNIKHPHALQIEMILDKAQLFYLQSVKHDLNKLKQDQKIQHLSVEDIKQYIQQINWKFGFDRETILNESQEVGDNIDLMKFFEGVRNYQNWQENLQKKTIQKLKNFSINAENQLKLRKGFLISRLQNIHSQNLRNRRLQFMNRLRKNLNIYNKLSTLKKIQKRQLRQTLLLVLTITKSKSSILRLQTLLKSMSDRHNKNNLLKFFRQISSKLKYTKNLVTAISKIQQKKLLLVSFIFFKKITIKTYDKYHKLGRGVEKLTRFSRKVAVKNIIKNYGMHFYRLIRVIDRLYLSKHQSSLKQIIQYGKAKKAMKDALSYRVKGKILLSIQRYQTKPINIRKTFLDWYLKTKEQKYSKMIYNIWLNGSISKFTFLMRIKNLLNQGKKQKIRQQLKVFLIVLMQKMGGYYNSCQKGFLNKWLDHHRYCKRLQTFISKLSSQTKQLDNNLLRQSLEQIKDQSKKKYYLIKYFKKNLLNKQLNCRKAFGIWLKVPKIKQLRGKQIFLSFIRNKLDQLVEDQKQTYQIFKSNHIQGQNKKIRFVSKVFAKDIGYLATFLNAWRRNIELTKLKSQNKQQKQNILKNNSSVRINLRFSKLQNDNLKEAFNNILRRSKYLKRRTQFSSKTLKQILLSSIKQDLTKSYNILKTDYQAGKIKKQKLVFNLIRASKFKQSQSLNIWLAGAKVQRQNQKKLRVGKVFALMNQNLKPLMGNLSNSKYLFNYLKRINNNYNLNVQLFLKYLRKLPTRIIWDKRKKAGMFYANLQHIIKKEKVNVHEKFKYNYYSAQFKKKKIVNFMYYQYVDCTKKYFKAYQTNVRQIKLNQKYNIILKVFESCNNIQRNNFDVLMVGESLWKKKGEKFNKLNIKLLQRLRHAFKLWQSTAKTLTFYNTINNEKKSRVLSKLTDMLSKNKFSQTKKTIQLFRKNSNIMQLQTNFLRRLCDTQAGKVIKALMIWKNLPKPKNKQIIAKASKFQRNLYNYAYKVLRHSISKFKDQHYFGNDRKKLAIRTLVAKSCTGIQKYFAIWKKNNKLITLFSQCHKVQSMFQIMCEVQAKKFSLLLDGNRSQLVYDSLIKIENWWNKKISRVLNIWRNKLVLLKNHDNKKQQSILTISSIEQNLQRAKVKKILLKLKKLMFLKDILSKHFVKRTKVNIFESFKKIESLPDRILIKKNNDKKKSVIQLFNKLQTQVRNDKIKIFQILRDIKYKGNFKKLKSCQQYLKDKISQVHKILVLWQNLTRVDKKQRKQRAVENYFVSSNLVCYSNFSHILQSIRATQIKRRCLQKIFNALQIKKKGLFSLWRSNVKQIKFNIMLDLSKKKSILQKINKLLQGSSNQNIKKALNNFYHNSKITQIQIRFIKRLLQTKSGKVLQAFNKWKKIPNQNLMQKYKKGQKFFFKLQGLIKNKLTQTHDNFLQNAQQGSTLKKQSVLQLLQITSSGIRRYYNRWIRITKRDHTLKQAYSMMHSLDALHQCISQNYKIVFQDQRNTKIKTWAIEKLINAAGLNTKTYFDRWRQINRQLKLEQQISRQQKKTALKMFTNVLGGSHSLQVKAVLQKFHKNLSIAKISKNFIQRLLKTKSGKVVQLFQLWKSIPNAKMAKKKKKAIKFQSNLNKMFIKFVKSGFQPFKISSHQARNRKRMCIQKLIRASMGEQKKKFLLWRQIVKQDKMLAHTHVFDNVFENLNQKLSSSINILIKNTPEQLTKKKALSRILINNSNFAQYHAYFIWKQALQIDNVKIQRVESKVKTNLSNLIYISKKVQSRKLVQLISMFKKKYVVNRKFASDSVKQNKNRKAINFYDNLSKYANYRISLFLKQMMKSHKEKEFIDKNTSIQKSFQNLMNVTSENLRIFMRSNRQTLIMQRALNKLFQNFKASTQRAFNMWKQYKNILNLQLKINSQKKKGVLEVLNRFLKKNQQSVKIPFAIERFFKNYKSLKLRKQILTKILRTKAGKVPLAFMIWKSLPNPGAKKMKQKGMKFQSCLHRLVTKGLKASYQTFKKQDYQGNNKKKFAVRKLILVTMSDSNRLFNNWRKVTSQLKITQKVLCLTKFFQQTQAISSSNLYIFNNFKQQLRIKSNAIRKIFDNTAINLSKSIQTWKDTVLSENNTKLKNTLEKFAPQEFNRHILQNSFNKIKRKAQMEVLRTYINSLWKWKMSSVQANYYAKFIKVFRESQQLITLSNCINKKKYENMHFAFRKVALQSLNRHQRKIRITQKYLMRKINNYYQRFKLNACFQQINTWRNMYKSTIKGKKLIDMIDNFARQQLYNAFMQICNLQVTKRNAQLFNRKIQRFNQLLLKKAFDKIHKQGADKFCNKLANVLNKISLRLKDSCFKQLNMTSRVGKLINLIQKISQKTLKKEAYDKVQYKSNLIVKYKLSINLIIYMEQQKRLRKTQIAIGAFKKNYKKKNCLINISNLMERKRDLYEKQFYRILKDGLDKKVLLSRFRKGMVLKKILEKQDKKVLKRIFEQLKKKQNVWISNSIKRFIIRSDLKSSLAVSLWRLKNYQSSIMS